MPIFLGNNVVKVQKVYFSKVNIFRTNAKKCVYDDVTQAIINISMDFKSSENYTHHLLINIDATS